MENWTQEQAAERQAKINRAFAVSKAMDTVTVICDAIQDGLERTQSPPIERDPKAAVPVGAKPERETGAARAQPQAKKSKYGNKRVQIDGIWFDSILEGRRYRDLDLLKAAGDISGFEMQVVYHLRVNGIHICDYRADFVVRYPDGRTEVEDTKGVETPKFVLQKKLMLAIYGIKIVLIRSKK